MVTTFGIWSMHATQCAGHAFVSSSQQRCGPIDVSLWQKKHS